MSIEVVAWIIIPLVLFLLGASGAGVTALVKFSGYMARSQVAQESTAKSNGQIVERLDTFIDKTDTTLVDYGQRIVVLEDRTRR